MNNELNVLELADLIESACCAYEKEAEAMLRQQQAEIEALKAENSHLKYEISSGAWNPVELTDEEIIACIDESEPDTADMIRFARAILKRAQEK
jgi:hypothetical protein